MSLLRGVQRLALRLGVAAAARGRLPLPPSCLATFRARFSSAAYHRTSTTAAARSRLFATGSGIHAPNKMYSFIDGDEMIPDLICGGINDAPGREMDPEAIELARFAVAEHNRDKDAALEFVRLVKVRTQMVAGLMYYFTVEVREVDGGAGSGANKLYEAKVWLRPWENFKGLDAFEPVANADEGETKV